MNAEQDGQGWSRRLGRLVRRTADRIQALPDGPRVFVLAGLLVAAALLLIAAVAFRVELWRAIALLVTAGLLLAIFVKVGMSASAWRRKRRRRGEEGVVKAAESHEGRAARSGLDTHAEGLMQAAAAATEREKLLADIAEGRVAPIDEPVALLLRDSETLWHYCQAWLRDREGEEIGGELYVTSLRVSFVSEEAPVEVPIGDVNAVQCEEGDLKLICKRAAETCTFVVEDAEVVAAYVARAARGG